MGPKWNPKKTFEETKKGDLRLPTPGEALGKPGSPGWSPAQTAQEIKEDPYRAGRLAAGMAATGGIPITELMTGYEKTTGKKLTSGWYPKTPTSIGQMTGTNPQINPADVLGGLGGAGGAGGVGSADYNPYAAQAAELAKAPMTPDFSAANKTAANQAALAQALGGFYGTGAGAVTDLMGSLRQQAQGDFGPRGSLAQAMLQQGLSQNIAGVRSQLASQRGLSPALAARYAAQQTAQLGGQTAQQAGILGLQQQLAAQQQLGALGMGAAELGAQTGANIYQAGRQADIAQAQAPVDAQLKKLSILAQSDVGLKEVAAKTGLGEAEIKMKIALANQAARQGDRDLAIRVIGDLIGAGSKAMAAGAGAPPTAAASPGIMSAGAGEGAAAAGIPFMASRGGRTPGMALVQGDSYQNDVVPAMLSPGEIVIPRSAAQDKNKAKAFLDALDGWNDKGDYRRVAQARGKK